MTKGTALVFNVKVTLPAEAADEYRSMTDDDGTELVATDEQIISDAVDYFTGWHFDAVIETINA
jgi:hypothetical protein